MKTIWKYPIPYLTPLREIEMPEGAEILTAQIQNGVLCLWAIVDTSKPETTRVIEIIGTGHEIQKGERKYIGTVYPDNGLVWHIFEAKKQV